MLLHNSCILLCGLLLLLCASMSANAFAPHDSLQIVRRLADARIARYVELAATTLDRRAAETLDRIPSLPRRLLALKFYTIRRAAIDSLWAFTNAEATAFRNTAEYAETMEHVDRVLDTFAVLNPGYHLDVNTNHRTYTTQLAKWNRVGSVGRAGNLIIALCRPVIMSGDFPQEPNVAQVGAFVAYLVSTPDSIEPTVAVPGMSGHGRLRAFDFRVKRGRRLIAGANSGSIARVWERGGWTDRLRDAIARASNRFAGPLPNPYEPWHWTYVPTGWVNTAATKPR